MKTEDTARRPIGKILVDSGFVTTDDLNLALLEQAHINELLGQMLVRMGALDPADITVKFAAGVRQMLGALLVKAGQITPSQLEMADAEQKKTGEKLGGIFVRLGLLTGHQLNDLLDYQNNRSLAQGHSSALRLGELLVSTGQITRERLDDALSKQAGSGKQLGEVLIEEGYADPHHVKHGLRIQQVILTTALAAVLSMEPIQAYGSTTVPIQAGGATIEMQAPAMDLNQYLQAKTLVLQVIHLPAGTYTISTPLYLPSNTVLEGEGDATIIRADASFIGSQVITNSDHADGNWNIFIRNLRMEVTLPQFPGGEPGILRFENVEGLEIENLTMVIDSPMYGIDLAAQVRNATVQGCTITNVSKVSGGGIMIRNGYPQPSKATSGIIVRYNQIESSSDEAVAAFGWEGVVENVRIEKNTISAHGASFGITAYGHGYAVPSQNGQIKGVEIIENAITGSKTGAIAIMGGAEDVAVTGNQIEGTEADGIFIHPGGDGLPPARNVTVSQNTIKNTGRHGIFAGGSDVLLDQNNIANCAGSGVYAVAGVVVTGNDVSNANPGILADGGLLDDIRGNSLHNKDRILVVNKDGTSFNVTSSGEVWTGQ